jgi:hypothetical protein
VIRYSLKCEAAHEFEGWFSSSSDFDSQLERGFLTCPSCNSSKIEKSLMAPSLATARRKEASRELLVDNAQKAALAQVKQAVESIKANADDVGDRFPEEARKIHYGESKERGIIGQASLKEAKELIDEGISVLPLPVLPENNN